MNQRTALLSYLKTHRAGITQFTAMAELGILRLSERVREMEESGHKFIRIRMRAIGRYGNAVYPIKYKLVA